MSKKKVTVLAVEFVVFGLPLLTLLWTGIFGAIHSAAVAVSSVGLFVVGLFVMMITTAVMD